MATDIYSLASKSLLYAKQIVIQGTLKRDQGLN